MLRLEANAQLQNYRLERRLGAGGMGEVWLAWLDSVKKPVAIKVIRPQFAADPQFRQRFLSEARTMASLAHERIIPLENFFDLDGWLVLVMPFFDGKTVKEVVVEKGGLPVEQALSITRDVLSALGAAHERGIVHRDVKPHNILLAKNGKAYLMDFGIAKDYASEEPGATGTGGVIGTPEYMSPEQILGQVLDGRSDLYSLGCVMYEMLAGQPPFAAQGGGMAGQTALIRMHLEQEPAPVSVMRPDAPGWVVAFVKQLLEKDRTKRFGGTSGWAEQCLAQLDGARSGGREAFAATTVVMPVEPPDRGTVVIPPVAEPVRIQAAPVQSSFKLPKAVPLVVAMVVLLGGGVYLVQNQEEPEKGVVSEASKEGVVGETKAKEKKEPPPAPSPAIAPPATAVAPPPAPRLNPAAEKHFAEAKRLRGQADYCLALAEINQALEIDPVNAVYLKFKEDMMKSC